MNSMSCVRAIEVLDYIIDNHTPKKLGSVIYTRQQRLSYLSNKIIVLSEFELLPSDS